LSFLEEEIGISNYFPENNNEILNKVLKPDQVFEKLRLVKEERACEDKNN
jgi:hypothetical protein